MRLALAILLFASVARGDLVTPGHEESSFCTLDQWLAVKHAMIRHCRVRAKEDEFCRSILEDLKRINWCDGEGKKAECVDPLYVRQSPDRCEIRKTTRGTPPTYRIEVRPDCYCWMVTAQPGKAAWKISEIESGSCVCD
jgi:hypothetical protein